MLDICSFHAPSPPSIAIDCKFNANRDWDRTCVTARLPREQPPCDRVLVVVPYINGLARSRHADLEAAAGRLAAALREAILNALVHRDYAVPAPVQIRVYRDKLSIWNPAILPEGWTLDNLRGPHSSRPHNPVVANAFFRSGEIEAWGRGIQRIFDACTSAKTPEPILAFQGTDFWIEFPFSEAHLRAVETSSSDTESGLDEKLDDELDEKLGKRRATILRAMAKNPSITVIELSGLLGISRNATDKNIQFLKTQGWIKRIGPPKSGHWEVPKS